MKNKKRLDVLLVERGLAPSRERAQGLILSGNVLVSDTPVTKPGTAVAEASEIRVRGEDHPYVSRGGIKLQAALEAFHVNPQGKVGLDIGASTGGFTQVLLMGGAQKVFAVDVGHNQMDWKIRQNPAVICLEKVNARALDYSLIGQKVDIIVIDVSFISLEMILPTLIQFAHAETDWITLIKPQFEVGRDKIGKGGIVTSESDRQEVLERIKQFGKTLGLSQGGLIDSPITGTQGNKEYLSLWKLTAD